MNSFKTLINKDVLTSKHFNNTDQPLQAAALFSALGVNYIGLNQWSTTPEENLEVYNRITDECLKEGVYLGAGLRKYREGEKEVAQVEKTEGEDEQIEKFNLKKEIYRWNTINYGVPLVRIV